MPSLEEINRPTRADRGINLGAETARLLAAIAETAPRIHCLTNSVAEPVTANALLAVGAVPSLTADPTELEDFLGTADALMINIGTPNAERLEARRMAAGIARSTKMPWVLDPVFADRSVMRRKEATRLIREAPTLIRANEAEVTELSASLAGYGGIVARTGATDRIRQESNTVRLTGGHPLLGKVTAVGCALSAVTAAFLAVSRDDPMLGAMAGLAAFSAAGAVAGRAANGEVTPGPGSFAVRLLDSLADLDADSVADHVAVVEEDAE